MGDLMYPATRDIEDEGGRRAFYRKAVWKESFCILPKRCLHSNKVIWLKKAYKGTSTYYGRGYTDTETHWHDRDQHLIWKLTYDPKDDFNILIPMIRRAMPALLAQNIVGVQPMTDISKKDE